MGTVVAYHKGGLHQRIGEDTGGDGVEASGVGEGGTGKKWE